MDTDNDVVQPTEPVSTQEPVSTGETITGVVEPAALTEERVQQLITEATALAVEQAKELGRRELQGQQDKNKAELARMERRAKLAEGTLGATRTRMQELDPDVAKEMELAELRQRDASRNTIVQEEAARQQQEAYAGALHESLLSHLRDLGVDPNDARIDWAKNSTNYLEGKTRFDKSIAGIVKEEKQTMQDSLDKRLKDLEAKMGQANIEANSVNTSTSAGVVAGSDAEFKKKFGSGELPMTKENVDRYHKIENTY